MSTRRLVVLRHSKAEQHAERDAARRLSERGRRDAADAGRYLASAGLVPDQVLVSAADRTQETWAEVHEQVGGDPLVHVTWDLYDADPDDVLDAVHQVPTDAGTVIYVGHNPTAEGLAILLADDAGDDEAREIVAGGLPTSGLAAFEVQVPWTDLQPGGGRLTHAHVGRG